MSLQVTISGSQNPWPFGTTLAEPSVEACVRGDVISISGALGSQGTATSSLSAVGEEWGTAVAQTHSGIQVLYDAPSIEVQRMSSGSALMELRRLSGLTWERLAELFGVSRRSLHFWASGKPQNSANEERLQRLLATLRKVDRGSARENRAALFEAQADGAMLFDLLVHEQYEKVVDRLGNRPRRVGAARKPLSAEAAAARMPPNPEELVGAMHDSVHREVGKARVARARRTKRR